MTLDELIRDLESGYKIGPDGDSAIAANGGRFVTITSAGKADEGNPPQQLHPHTSERDAIEAFLQHIEDYAQATPGDTLFWRKRPVVRRYKTVHRGQESYSMWTETGPFFRVQARLLIGYDTRDQQEAPAGMLTPISPW